ncbi:hypothetical protein [Pseudomonas sp. H3(2019)]|uniref:hypothetical protein n=1 Tax=Pseudomonas sp. H3(2019) TaxID=2598724 RepID=UPI0011921403|nr:hypothetical protein [Pseudomonas sp. H3(2019)]TVT83941.1 hypothetical protein FPT12_10010 [Pseudomonas sp. H3(2019)]
MKRLFVCLIFGLFVLMMGVAQAVEGAGPGMMANGMMGGGMMAVCAVFGLLILAVLVLAILALIKYLRSGK